MNFCPHNDIGFLAINAYRYTGHTPDCHKPFNQLLLMRQPFPFAVLLSYPGTAFHVFRINYQTHHNFSTGKALTD